jgi:hypothetical protein
VARKARRTVIEIVRRDAKKRLPQMTDDEIPDDIVGPERTLQQMFKFFVEPEVKRR